METEIVRNRYRQTGCALPKCLKITFSPFNHLHTLLKHFYVLKDNLCVMIFTTSSYNQELLFTEQSRFLLKQYFNG